MKTVYFDIDTQFDFLYPAGGLYASGAERIVPTIAKLNRRAIAQGSVVISTTDAHSENDPEFAAWPHHCVAGTLGQRKPQDTLIGNTLVIPSYPSKLSLTGVSQITLEKQHVDCFTNQNLPAILEALQADRYVVYGVVTEVCVKLAALGLLRTGKSVDIVTDAIRVLQEETGRQTLADLEAAGGRLITSGEL